MSGEPTNLFNDEIRTRDEAADEMCVEIKTAELDGTIRCVRCRSGSQVYRTVIAVAAARYGLPEQLMVTDQDTYSDIFALLEGDELVATVTATRNAVGPIEASEFYPPEVISEFGSRVVTAYRLATKPGCKDLALIAVRVACRYSLQRGARLALVSSKPEPNMLRWYRTLGFDILSSRPYLHPRLGTEHIALFCPADPNGNNKLADLFRGIDGPVSKADVRAVLTD